MIETTEQAVALIQQTEPVTPAQFDELRTWVVLQPSSEMLKWMLDNEPEMAAFRKRNAAMLKEFYANN